MGYGNRTRNRRLKVDSIKTRIETPGPFMLVLPDEGSEG